MRPPFPRRRRRRPDPEARAAVLFLLPSLAGTAVFVLLPFAETVRRSFFDTLGRNFVGLANYRSVLGNSAFRLAAKNTARFVCTCVPLLLAVSLLLALGVRAVARRRDGSETRRGRLFRTSFLLPMAIPVASIVVLWQALFAQNGLVNGALAALGAQPVDFMGTGAAFWVLVLTYVWKNAGYDMVLWLAGLDGISADLYEAAAVDGAGAFRPDFGAAADVEPRRVTAVSPGKNSLYTLYRNMEGVFLMQRIAVFSAGLCCALLLAGCGGLNP